MRARGRLLDNPLARALALLWLAACLLVFFMYPASGSTVHNSYLKDWALLGGKLARIDVIACVLGLLIATAGCAVFCAACLAAGSRFLWHLPSARVGESESQLGWLARLATAVVLGAAILSMVFMALAELRLLNPPLVGGALVAAILLGVRPLLRFFRAFPLPQPEVAPLGTDRLILLPVAAAMLSAILYSAARLSYDASAVYFSDAKLTAVTHALRYFTADSFVASVLHTAVQYAAIIELFGDQASRLYSWANGALILVFTLAIAQQVGLSGRARLILAALVASTTAYIDLLGDGKIDLASAAPAFAAIYWMVVSEQKGRSRAVYLLTGLLAGMAIVARPYQLPPLAAIIACFEVERVIWGSGQGTSRWVGLARAAGWMVLGALPWAAYHVLANWIVLGDPLAFAHNLGIVQAGTWQWYFPMSMIWQFRLIYPLTVTFLNTPQSLGTISPLFIGLLPLATLAAGARRLNMQSALTRLATAAAVALALWMLMTFFIFEVRYVFPLWFMLFMPVAAGVDSGLGMLPQRLATITRGAICILLGFVALRAIYVSLDSYSPISADGSAHCKDYAVCSFIEPVNRLAQPGDRVLTLNAFRYYLRPDLFACSTSPAEYSTLGALSHRDSTLFWTEVYREGYRYVAYEQEYATRHLRLGLIANPYNTPPWMRLEPVAGQPGDPVVAYRIVVSNPPIRAEQHCGKTAGTWEVLPSTNTDN